MSDSPEKEKETVRSLLSDLKQLRDEMSVQMHLAGSELKEQWDKLDDQYHKLSHDYDPLKDAVGETAEGVWTGLKLTAEELLKGFHRIRKSL